MGRFRRTILHLDQQDTSPGAHRAKIALRRRVLENIGADKARVFDGFAGTGAMHDAVWHAAASCVGCDRRHFLDARECFVADNRRVMRSIDLAEFNLFDFDAYGSPWDQLYILAGRRPIKPAERVGLVITEGTGMKFKMGSMQKTLALLAGMRAIQSGIGSADAQDEIVNRALIRMASMMRASIAKRWQAVGKGGSRVLYIGLILEGAG
jgi:hypothetical protein